MAENSTRGTLYLVGTPIGNLEDITYRAIRTLKEVQLVACEDTRQTQKLLNHYGIETHTTSYHEHNELTKSAELVMQLEQGKNIALVTDAGMPGISDPGFRLVTLAIRHHIPVVPIPGPSAFLSALVASGLPTDAFRFLGFLPSKEGQRAKALEQMRNSTRTVIFYEAPHRVARQSCRKSYRSWARNALSSLRARLPSCTRNLSAARRPMCSRNLSSAKTSRAKSRCSSDARPSNNTARQYSMRIPCAPASAN